MPDWNHLVRKRLGKLELPENLQDEVVSELAAHLEDFYQEQLDAGKNEAEALKHMLAQDSHWQQLAKDIECAKRKEAIMNTRTKQIWIPALVSLTASMGWMMALQIASTKLQMPWKHAGVAFMPYVIWFFTLPLIGAVSGYLSLRAGSRRAARIAAVVFPSIVMAVLWLVLVAVVIARKSPHPFQTLNFAYGFMLWVVAPALALLAGTLPFSRQHKLTVEIN